MIKKKQELFTISSVASKFMCNIETATQERKMVKKIK